MGITHMSGNTFQVGISADKFLKHSLLLFKIRLHGQTVFHISQTVILFIFPEMIGFNSQKHIHIGQTPGTEIPGLLPGPQGTAEIPSKLTVQTFFTGNFQTG